MSERQNFQIDSYASSFFQYVLVQHARAGNGLCHLHLTVQELFTNNHAKSRVLRQKYFDFFWSWISDNHDAIQAKDGAVVGVLDSPTVHVFLHIGFLHHAQVQIFEFGAIRKRI